MIIYEFKESVLNDMFGEIDEAKKGLSKAKSVMCHIEDILYDMIDGKEYSEDGKEEREEYDGDGEISFRRRRNMRGYMKYRHASQMRDDRYNY